MRARAWWCALLLACTASLQAAPPSDAAALQGLDAYVQQVMRDWQVPGLAIAVVRNDKLVLARGYGVRKLGEPGKVDADTLFDIGSNSKAFTVAALGTLVASGKLKWDDPVSERLPEFRLSDPWVTRHVTLRDLLTHRTGHCDPTLAWYTSDATDIVARVRYQKPEYGFRTTFCYNNVQYLAASRLIPAITGQDWNDYVSQHLFQPLGMTRTVSTDAAVDTAGDVASPHGMLDGAVAVIPRYWPHNMDLFAAVGGIWSSANDMTNWLRMLLDDGRLDGRGVLDADIVEAMETPQVVIQPGTGVGGEIRVWMPGGHFYTYGLGLFVQDYHGHALAWHAGDIDGMASAMALVPDAGLGVVVLSNMDHADARFAIIARVLQSMLDLPRDDLEPALLAMQRKQRAAAAASDQKRAATRSGKPPSLPLSAYAGNYHDKLDGSARVTLEHGHLVLQLGNPAFMGRLEPWHDNTFRVAWRDRFYGHAYATFDSDDAGAVTRLGFEGMPLHYSRTPAPSDTAPAERR